MRSIPLLVVVELTQIGQKLSMFHYSLQQKNDRAAANPGTDAIVQNGVTDGRHDTPTTQKFPISDSGFAKELSDDAQNCGTT
ncbi:MAG: hypothetical protein O2856_05890 [Planctomycetota bacterium]|nr:hypothetical protein [Planctomycetota bacterium]